MRYSNLVFVSVAIVISMVIVSTTCEPELLREVDLAGKFLFVILVTDIYLKLVCLNF